MKRISKLLGSALLVVSQIFALNIFAQAQQQQQPDESWKNWYAVAWRDKPTNSLRYAKQMGYEYIALGRGGSPSVYKNDPNSAGMKYYWVDPYYENPLYGVYNQKDANNITITYPRIINPYNSATGKGFNYTQAQKDWYNQYMVWGQGLSASITWPNNLATWAFWDFQQQAVINEVVNGTILSFSSYENQAGPFTFAGYILDVPALTGMWSRNNQTVTLAAWTGTDSGDTNAQKNYFSSLPTSIQITHDYSNFSDGMAAFYKQLNTAMKAQWPNAKFIVEPGLIYNPYNQSKSWTLDDYVWQVSQRGDRNSITPDMLSEEWSTTDFVDDFSKSAPLAALNSMNITKSMVGSSQSSEVGELINRQIAAKAGINGAWFNWFGRFGGAGGRTTMPDFQSITQVYPRLKLIRCIPNWDNLNNIPLADRSWNGSVYQSTNSYISSDVMYSRHPGTANPANKGKLFAVFNTNTIVSKIKLKPGESVTSVHRATPYFEEEFNDLNDNGVRDSGESLIDARLDVTITNNILGDEITLNSSVTIDVDLVGIKGVGKGQVKGNGYIFTLSQSATPPAATTKQATNIASDSATLNGLVNPNGADITNNIYFDYGTTSGNYTGKINANPNSIPASSGDKSVGANLGGLSSSTTYYYRVAATNSAGTTNGNETSFTTTAPADAMIPTGSISINSRATYTNATAVSLSLSASDDVGVNGYYVSASSVMPSVNISGWVDINSMRNYNATVTYALNTGDGLKTVYCWYKDSSDKISNRTSDSINLDTSVPAINITIPTANTFYNTTSSAISIGGTSADNNGSGIQSLAWYSNKEGSGTIAGGPGGTWTTGNISLVSGNNVITVTARDNAGNVNNDTITIGYTPGVAPSVITGPIQNVTYNTGILSATVNAGGLQTAAYFDYGISSSAYSFKTFNQTVNGSNNTTITANISALSSNTTYYFRAVAVNSAGSAYGSQRTFTTNPPPDTLAPTGSISINKGANYTNTSNAALLLSATDNIGVTGYYVSTAATAPIANSSGWMAVSAVNNYSGNINYTLSEGDGTKTVNVWYKDAAGCISSIASDSIALDTIAPVVSLNSPVNNTTVSGIINVNATAYDNSLVSVFFKLDGANLGIEDTVGPYSVSWNTTTATKGSHSLTATATDSAGNTKVSSAVTVTVNNNNAPILAAIGNKAIDENKTLGFNLSATDQDGDTLTYSAIGLPQGFALNSSTGSFIWTPSYSQSGSYPVTFSVNDGSLNDTEAIIITVNDVDTITPTGSISINGGAAYINTTAVNLSLSASDNIGVNGYYLSANASVPTLSAPGWSMISNALAKYNATINYTLNGGNGQKTVYCWYRDSAGMLSSGSNDSIILDTTPPAISITIPTSNSTYTTASSVITLGGSASGGTSGMNRVAWSNNRGGSGTAVGTSNWSIANISLARDDNVINVTARDNAGNIATSTLMVTQKAALTTGVTINNGAASANSIFATLGLSAYDKAGIKGYYISNSNSTPSLNDTFWKPVDPAVTNFQLAMPYLLSGSDGDKTIYVWYKNSTNALISVSDSITLNTTGAAISDGTIVFKDDFENKLLSRNIWSSNADFSFIEGTGAYNGSTSIKINHTVTSGNPSKIIRVRLPSNYLKGHEWAYLEVSAMIRTENLSNRTSDNSGINFGIAFDDEVESGNGIMNRGIGYINETAAQDISEWTKYYSVTPITSNNTTNLRVPIGLNNVNGTVFFDNVELKLIKVIDSSDLPRPQNAIAPTENHTKLRGAMVAPRSVTKDDLKVLGADWNANLVRWFMGDGEKGISSIDITNSTAFDPLVDKWLNDLDSFTPVFKEYGMRAVISFSKPVKDRLFINKDNQRKIVELWKEVAERFKDNETIWAYDIANEPTYTAGWGGAENGVLLWHDIAEKIAQAIREIDPQKTIIVEGEWTGDLRGFMTAYPINASNVTYGPHMYEPLAFSHQGYSNSAAYLAETHPQYPGTIDGRNWDKKELIATLKPMKDFQDKYNVPVYFGEFGTVRWAPKNADGESSALRYLNDVIEIFEEYGWDWTFHCFRDEMTRPFNLEYNESFAANPTTADGQITTEPSDREKLVRRWMANNKKPYGMNVSFPVVSLVINPLSNQANPIGNDFTNNRTVALTLSAAVAKNLTTDPSMINGYYISNNPAKPSVQSPEWVSLSPTNFSFYNNITHTLAAGGGSKTVYAWVKDEKNIVSEAGKAAITFVAPEARLKAYYNFEEEENRKVVMDASGNSNSAEFSNNPVRTNPVSAVGKIGNSLSFDGVDDYISFNTHLNIRESLTVSAWVYPTNTTNGVIINTYAYNSGSGRGWILGNAGASGGKNVYFRVYNSTGGFASASSNTTFFKDYLDTWGLVTGVFKPSEYIKLYVNGKSITNTTSGIPASIGYKDGANLRLCARADVSSQGAWNGKIDEVRIYNKALTDAEVEVLHNTSRAQ